MRRASKPQVRSSRGYVSGAGVGATNFHRDLDSTTQLRRPSVIPQSQTQQGTSIEAHPPRPIHCWLRSGRAARQTFPLLALGGVCWRDRAAPNAQLFSHCRWQSSTDLQLDPSLVKKPGASHASDRHPVRFCSIHAYGSSGALCGLLAHRKASPTSSAARRKLLLGCACTIYEDRTLSQVGKTLMRIIDKVTSDVQ